MDERLLRVWKTIMRERSVTCNADTGGASNQSSVYASSEAIANSKRAASPASRS